MDYQYWLQQWFVYRLKIFFAWLANMVVISHHVVNLPTVFLWLRAKDPSFVPVFYAFQGFPGGFRRQGKPQPDHQWRALALQRRAHAQGDVMLVGIPTSQSTSEWCIHGQYPQPWQTKVIITVSSIIFEMIGNSPRWEHLWIYYGQIWYTHTHSRQFISKGRSWKRSHASSFHLPTGPLGSEGDVSSASIGMDPSRSSYVWTQSSLWHPATEERSFSNNSNNMQQAQS